MITRTAFQPSAFQFTGFQEATTAGGGWGWWEYFRARAAHIARRKREEAEEQAAPQPEPALAYVRLGALRPSIVAKPIVTDLSAMAARLSPPVDVELEEFRAFMELITQMEEA
jgi:hypothetical protein